MSFFNSLTYFSANLGNSLPPQWLNRATLSSVPFTNDILTRSPIVISPSFFLFPILSPDASHLGNALDGTSLHSVVCLHISHSPYDFKIESGQFLLLAHLSQ